jgi:hypothetical protein
MKGLERQPECRRNPKLRRGGVRMIRMELTPEEAEILRESLESYFSDLRMEIAGTESMVFREILKKKEAFLLRIIQQLQPDSS